ncbi:hypothetical protein PHLGIDRAFT_471258 [Phlebiopsis gigantea 11061_1 CR5-6]|uniref:Uncharacterized protein n=1 Tax=Phlebiopsis gigantea (strain 11061_1 CR5-6) TaxID=745531 RepID=A0A0C3S9C4_PHLG1|nr:hypothetical protein PHLGIDRAFT_471258 [Phlebiopsis gigantea 11061_1 CR5-6]
MSLIDISYSLSSTPDPKSGACSTPGSTMRPHETQDADGAKPATISPGATLGHSNSTVRGRRGRRSFCAHHFRQNTTSALAHRCITPSRSSKLRPPATLSVVSRPARRTLGRPHVALHIPRMGSSRPHTGCQNGPLHLGKVQHRYDY